LAKNTQKHAQNHCFDSTSDKTIYKDQLTVNALKLHTHKYTIT